MKKLILFLLLFCHYCYSYPGDVHELTGKDYFPAVKKFLSEAKKSIYVSLYIATYHPDYPTTLPNQLLQELVAAQKRGLDVKVILDQGGVTSPKGQYNDMAYFFLKESGVDVNYDIPSTKLHDKLIIIDESIVIIGSHNWSKNALAINYESSVVIKSPELADKYIQWIKSIPVALRRTPPAESRMKGIYLPYQFLTNPKLGSNFHEYTFKLYFYLLSRLEEVNHSTIILDYDNAARFIGLNKFSKKIYRKLINGVLRNLRDSYKLVSFKSTRNKPAEIILLDYDEPRKPYAPDIRKCFLVPGNFWEFGWVQRLSKSAKYFFLINIIETNLTSDPNGWWSSSRRNLDRKYHLSHWTIGKAALELKRYNVIEIKYGQIYPLKKKRFTPPKYLLHSLYSWEWFEGEIKRLEEQYGAKRVEIARRWASVVLEENNLVVIERLINYFNNYGGAVVQYAVDRIALKRIGNPKRSFPYLEGIILNKSRQGEEPEDAV